MKKKIILAASCLAVAILVFCGGLKVGAATNQAGSVSDPLITQSYLEQRLDELVNGSASFSRVTVAKGKTFLASEGTMFFLYSGSGTVTGTEGLTDLTAGELFSNGNIMVKYHLFLAPAAGNGVKASAETVLYVQGTYSIR